MMTQREAGRVLLGMLTPSSNTVLEPVCAEMLRGLPEVSAHFARFRVTSISLDESSLGQFDLGPMLEAASLLADARVGSICWNGTSASWLGLDTDRMLCRAVEERTGIPATSSVLALAEIFRRAGVRRFGLVTPYTGDVQARIVANMGREGFDCVAERRLDITDNFPFSCVPAGTLRRMVREVAAARPDAITILCTNLRGAPLDPLHQSARGAAGRGIGGGDRYPHPRFHLGRGLELATPRRCGSQAGGRMGAPVPHAALRERHHGRV